MGVSKAVLYQDVDGSTYEVDLPLTSSVSIDEILKELGLPSYIDLSYFPMRSAIVAIWACRNAPELSRLYPDVYEKRVDKNPIKALLFGGGALKIHCEHSNGEGGLSRSIKDADFIVPKRQGSNFCKMLFGMSSAFGSEFTYFKTKGDQLFNAMRQGERYRVRTINGVNEEGSPTVTILDVFCDSIDLRHKIDVKDSFDRFKENLYTIGLEHLLLSKAQFIMDYPKSDLGVLEKHGQGFRVLPYPYYASDKVILGMETKDVKDVCAIFVDHPVGNGNEEIDRDRIKNALKRDSRLALTVSLNLRNLADRTDLLARWLTKAEVNTVVGRIHSVLEVLPEVDKKWDKPWWNTAVETPKIE